MRLKNISQSKFEFTQPKKDQKKGEVLETIAVEPGGELAFEKDDPLYEQLVKLPAMYPKQWIVVDTPKLSEEELKAQLAEREAEKKAKAETPKATKAEKKEEKKDA